MIGIRSAFSIRARGQWPHLEAVYMTAPRLLAETPRNPLPRGGRPYMTERCEKTEMETFFMKSRFLLISVVAAAFGAAVTPASAQKTLKVVQHSDIKVIDPIWSAA